MNTNHQDRRGLLKVKKDENKALTAIDIVSHLFVVGIFLMTVPIFLQPSTTDSSVGYRDRAVIQIRLSF